MLKLWSGIYLGDATTALCIGRLQEMGVTAVVNVSQEKKHHLLFAENILTCVNLQKKTGRKSNLQYVYLSSR